MEIDDEMVERAVRVEMGATYPNEQPAAYIDYQRSRIRRLLEAALNPKLEIEVTEAMKRAAIDFSGEWLRLGAQHPGFPNGDYYGGLYRAMRALEPKPKCEHEWEYKKFVGITGPYMHCRKCGEVR